MDTTLLTLENRNNFIEENKLFIYSTAYKVCKRKLDWKNDDELSVAMVTFNKACDNYNENKGDFFSYAKVLIKNALIDYFRKNKNTPYLIFDSEEGSLEYIDNKNSMKEHEIVLENMKRAEEIKLFSIELSMYKLSFASLVDSSPSHYDTRNSLLNLAVACSKEESILTYIKSKKLLPVKEITLLTGAKRKLIEKWRKYILTLIILISSDDYPYIKSYLNIKVGEIYE